MFCFTREIRCGVYSRRFFSRTFYPPVVNMYPASPCYESITESRTLSALQERGKKSENETEPSRLYIAFDSLSCFTLPSSLWFYNRYPVQADTAFYPSRVGCLEGRPNDFIGCDPARPSIFRSIPFIRTEKGFKWLQYPLVLTPGIGKTFLCPWSCLIFNASLTPSLARGINFYVN